MLSDQTIVVSHGPEIGNAGEFESLHWEQAKLIPTEEIEFKSMQQDGIFNKYPDYSNVNSTVDIAEALLAWKRETAADDHALDPEILSQPQTIPTFEQVCDTCVKGGLVMNIELKV